MDPFWLPLLIGDPFYVNYPASGGQLNSREGDTGLPPMITKMRLAQYLTTHSKC
jgi:hypothetical protein